MDEPLTLVKFGGCAVNPREVASVLMGGVSERVKHPVTIRLTNRDVITVEDGLSFENVCERLTYTDSSLERLKAAAIAHAANVARIRKEARVPEEIESTASELACAVVEYAKSVES